MFKSETQYQIAKHSGIIKSAEEALKECQESLRAYLATGGTDETLIKEVKENIDMCKSEISWHAMELIAWAGCTSEMPVKH